MKSFTESQLVAVTKSKMNGIAQRLLETARQTFRELNEVKEELSRLKDVGSELECARPDREISVLMIHADGFVELFGEKWQGCRVLYVPEYEDVKATEAEMVLINSLPLKHRELIWANRVIATGHVRCCPTKKGIEQAIKVREADSLLSKLKEAVTKLQTIKT